MKMRDEGGYIVRIVGRKSTISVFGLWFVLS